MGEHNHIIEKLDSDKIIMMAKSINSGNIIFLVSIITTDLGNHDRHLKLPKLTRDVTNN